MRSKYKTTAQTLLQETSTVAEIQFAVITV